MGLFKDDELRRRWALRRRRLSKTSTRTRLPRSLLLRLYFTLAIAFCPVPINDQPGGDASPIRLNMPTQGETGRPSHQGKL